MVKCCIKICSYSYKILTVKVVRSVRRVQEKIQECGERGKEKISFQQSIFNSYLFIQLKLQIEIRDFRALIGSSLIFASQRAKTDVTRLKNVRQFKQKYFLFISAAFTAPEILKFVGHLNFCTIFENYL